jgi:hypothetical protein
VKFEKWGLEIPKALKMPPLTDNSTSKTLLLLSRYVPSCSEIRNFTDTKLGNVKVEVKTHNDV